MHIHEHLQQYGADALSFTELLVLVLNPRSQSSPHLLGELARLLQHYPPRQLRQAGVAELEQAGLSSSQAARLVAMCELTRRFALLEMESLPQITSPLAAANLLMAEMACLDHEEMRILVLDSKNQVVENINRYRGTVNSSVLRVAEIYRPAITRNCPAILVCHNHPSGDPTPSPEDITVTEQLVQAGKLLDIELVDHLIIGNHKYVSLRQKLCW